MSDLSPCLGTSQDNHRTASYSQEWLHHGDSPDWDFTHRGESLPTRAANDGTEAHVVEHDLFRHSKLAADCLGRIDGLHGLGCQVPIFHAVAFPDQDLEDAGATILRIVPEPIPPAVAAQRVYAAITEHGRVLQEVLAVQARGCARRAWDVLTRPPRPFDARRRL